MAASIITPATKTDLLQSLKNFTLAATGELIMPTRMQKGDTAQAYRAADVYLMRLTDSSSAAKKVPYILHMLVTAKDKQPNGQKMTSTAQVQTVFCVYCDDEQEGGLMLLNLMERLRIALEKQVLLDQRFELDLAEGPESYIYREDTAPYFGGEMWTSWIMPTVRREIPNWP